MISRFFFAARASPKPERCLAKCTHAMKPLRSTVGYSEFYRCNRQIRLTRWPLLVSCILVRSSASAYPIDHNNEPTRKQVHLKRQRIQFSVVARARSRRIPSVDMNEGNAQSPIAQKLRKHMVIVRNAATAQSSHSITSLD